MFNAALAQIPAPLRAPDEHGRIAVLVRTDAAGATKEFAAHLHAQGVEFSVGASLGHFDIHTALATLPKQAWTPAYQARKPRAAEQGVQIEPRDGAWIAEATKLVDMSSWPAGTRLILRKQRPHPGAQLRVTDADGLRVTGFSPTPPSVGPATSSPTSNYATAATPGSRTASFREAKDTGSRNLPFHDTDQNRIWLGRADHPRTHPALHPARPLSGQPTPTTKDRSARRPH